MRELPFQLQHPPNPPPDNFSELFRIPVNVDIGNYRKVDIKDGMFGKRVEIKFIVVFLANKSILHVVEKSYEDLATFNRICFERRLILRSTRFLFPSMKADSPHPPPSTQLVAKQRNSLMMSLGAAVGSNAKEVDHVPTNVDSVNTLVVGIKVWLAALWADQPLFHCMDYVRSFFDLGNKVEIPVKPYLWCPTTLSASKPLIEERGTTELAARIVAEAAALQVPSPNSADAMSEDARRPSLALFRGLKGNKRPDEQAPAHFEDIEGEEHTLRITFHEGPTGLVIVNGDSTRDASGKFNGPLFVRESIGQAALLGVQVGDRLLAYNGKPVRKGLKSQEFKQKMKRKGRPMTLTICRKVRTPREPTQAEAAENYNSETKSEVKGNLNVYGISSSTVASDLMPSPKADEEPSTIHTQEVPAMSSAMVTSQPQLLKVSVPMECVCRVDGSRLHFVEIYENQRFNGLLESAWGSTPFPGHLLPADRSAWTSQDGKVAVDVLDSELAHLEPPPSFEWKGQWEIDFDYTPCDDQGFAYALDFWLLSSMQEEGSSMESDADACFVRRRRWRRTLVQPRPPTKPTPYISGLCTAVADGKGVYSRRAVALAVNVSHRIFSSKTTEDSYGALQNILGCEGFEALWRGCGIAIVCASRRTANDLARALTSCGWPAMVFTAGNHTSLVDDSGCVHAPRIFVTTDTDIKSSLEETVAAASRAENEGGGDGLPANLLPMPVDMIVHFELPTDFGTFLRRIERAFRGRLLEVNSTLISVVLANDREDDVLLPWLVALVNDAGQLEDSPCLMERAHKLQQSLGIDCPDNKTTSEYIARNHEDDVPKRDGHRWDVFGAVGSVLSYNFGATEKDDSDDDDSVSSRDLPHHKIDDDESKLYINQPQAATVSPFIRQQTSAAGTSSTSMLRMSLPLFSAPQDEEQHSSESDNSGENF